MKRMKTVDEFMMEIDSVTRSNIVAVDASKIHTNGIYEKNPNYLIFENGKIITLVLRSIKKIPKSITDLTNLENLRIDYTGKSQLPEFNKLSNLRTLVLYIPNLFELPKTLVELDHLVSLKINHLLKDFNHKLSQLKNLEILSISLNSNSDMVIQELNSLPKLKQLTLFDLNDQIDLTKIQILNQIHKLTISRSKLNHQNDGNTLGNIKTLSINSTEFRNLNSFLDQLPQLTKLKIQYSKFDTIDISLGFLQELILENCHEVDKFPFMISSFKTIKHLNLSNNNLKQIDKDICELVKLETLFASGNKIQKIPICLFNLPNISVIELSKNNIQENTFPSDLRISKSLKIVDLQKNKIKDEDFLKQIFQKIEKLVL